MGKSANNQSELAKRKEERLHKADRYSATKSAAGKLRAKTHARIGNEADSVVTALGSKTLGAIKGGAWGLFKGVFAGGVAGAIGLVMFSGVLMSPFLVPMGITMLIMGVKGLHKGYYDAEAKIGKGQKVGDRIAAAGNAQAPKVKRKNLQKAAEQATKELDKLAKKEVRADAEVAEIEKEKDPNHYRDMVDNSRAKQTLERY